VFRHTHLLTHTVSRSGRAATEQGLPAKITDESVLRELARLMGLPRCKKDSKEDLKAK